MHYVIGNAATPRERLPAAILHCLDASGRWPSRGFFKSIAEFTHVVGEQYESAKEAKDLKMGDLHLVPPNNSFAYALAVCMKYNSQKQTMEFDFEALRVTLLKLRQEVKKFKASVHLPRIGSSRDPQQNHWYSVERLVRNIFAREHIHVYVYYFRKNLVPPIDFDEIEKNDETFEGWETTPLKKNDT